MGGGLHALGKHLPQPVKGLQDQGEIPLEVLLLLIGQPQVGEPCHPLHIFPGQPKFLAHLGVTSLPTWRWASSTMARKVASSTTGRPNCRAFSNLEPGSVPTTT